MSNATLQLGPPIEADLSIKLFTGTVLALELEPPHDTEGPEQRTRSHDTWGAEQGSTPIESVKAMIQNYCGVPCHQQRLIFAGTRLESGHTLADYGVQKGAVVTMETTAPFRGPWYARAYHGATRAACD